ncbi:hypothetical protein WAI453_013721 [Rhynchosporium graminicola]
MYQSQGSSSPAARDQDVNTTIREYLQLNGVRCHPVSPYTTGTSTKKSAGSGSHVSEIHEWDDFALSNINQLFGDVLDEPVLRPRLPSLPNLPYEQLRVYDEDSFEAVTVADTARILNTALVVGAELWTKINPKTAPVHPVLMLKGGYGMIIPNCKPDWSGIRRRERDGEEHGDGDGEPNERPPSLVCGESKFSMEHLKVLWKDRGDLKTANSETPKFHNICSWLHQANVYAALHETRFFYIIMPRSAFNCCRRFAEEPHFAVRTPNSKRPTAPRGSYIDSSPASQEPRTPKGKAAEDTGYESTPAGQVSTSADVGIHLADVDLQEPSATKLSEEEETLSVILALWTIHMLAAIGETGTLPLSGYKDFWSRDAR